MNRIAIMVAGAALIYGAGFYMGGEYCEGQQAQREAAALAESNRQVLALQMNEARLLNQARQFEDAANADPINDECGIDADRVRRLNNL